MSQLENNQKTKLVIFDFDGVLVNTAQLSYELNLISNPDLTYDQLKSMSNGNFHAIAERSETAFTHYPEFHQKYKARIRDFDTPIEVQNAIKTFSRNYVMAIISSGSEDSIQHFLEKEDLLKCFDEIWGFETDKSKIVKISNLLEKYTISIEDTVFITDTLGDILEGNEVGIRSVGVTWGLHERELLARGNPVVIIDDPSLLEKTVETLLRG